MNKFLQEQQEYKQELDSYVNMPYVIKNLFSKIFEDASKNGNFDDSSLVKALQLQPKDKIKHNAKLSDLISNVSAFLICLTRICEHNGIELWESDVDYSVLTPATAKEAYTFLQEIENPTEFLKEHARFCGSMQLLATYESGDFDTFEAVYNSFNIESAQYFSSAISSQHFRNMQNYIPDDVNNVDELFEYGNETLRSLATSSITKMLSNNPLAESFEKILNVCPTMLDRLKRGEEGIALNDSIELLKSLLTKYNNVKDRLRDFEIEHVEQILSSPDCKDIVDEVRAGVQIAIEDNSSNSNVLELPNDYFKKRETVSGDMFIRDVPERYRGALADLINWLADENYIDKDLEAREHLAFILSGHGYKGDMNGRIVWYKEPETILNMCKWLYATGGRTPKGVYNKAKTMFDCGNDQERFMRMKTSSANDDRNTATREFSRKMKEFFS